MSAYARDGVLSGQTLDLRVVFTDDANMLVDSDALPEIYIYDQSVDLATIEAETLATTFTSALAGPLTPTKIATGFYELAYTVPGGSTEGTWHDVWTSTVDGINSNQIFTFRVENGAVLTAQVLLNNELIIIELDASIANVLGSLTLNNDAELSFSTVYSPLYASPDLLRAEAGPFINYIPDDTLALLIHWSSKEADFIGNTLKGKTKDFKFARTKFVVFDAILKALTIPSDGTGSTAGNKKKLGDLSIDNTNSGSSVAVTSSGIDIKTLQDFKTQRDEWWRVVNAGGCIVPGQGFNPDFAVKGRYSGEGRIQGRLWENPSQVAYPQPGANSKVRRSGRLRGRFTFSNIPGRWNEDD